METAQKRKNDILASNLLFLNLAISQGIVVVRTGLLIFSLGLLILLTVGPQVGLAYAIRRGHYWAKVMLAMLFVLRISFFSRKVLSHALQGADPLSTVTFVLDFILHIGVFVLLFKKPRLSAWL